METYEIRPLSYAYVIIIRKVPPRRFLRPTRRGGVELENTGAKEKRGMSL